MRWMKEIAAKIAAPFKSIMGMGLWQIANWIYDTPIWIAGELKYGFKGVVALMIGAIIINLCALLYYRRKKVSWLCWDSGVEVLKTSSKLVARVAMLAGIFFGTFFSMNVSSGLIVFAAVMAIGGILRIIILGLRISWLEGIIMFFFLSFYQDSFIATAYLRRGRVNGIQARDYAIFSASSVVSVFYWAIRNGIIAETLRLLLKA